MVLKQEASQISSQKTMSSYSWMSLIFRKRPRETDLQGSADF